MYETDIHGFEDVRTRVLAEIANQGLSHRELARRVSAGGFAAEATVMQWLSGRVDNPTLKTWYGVERVLGLR
mgnify:CR=1 FL=1